VDGRRVDRRGAGAGLRVDSGPRAGAGLRAAAALRAAAGCAAGHGPGETRPQDGVLGRRSIPDDVLVCDREES